MILLQCVSDSCSPNNTIEIVCKIAIAVLFAILFVQSVLDKIFHYASNKTWLQEHFSKSIFNKSISVFFPTLLLLELATGIMCVIGIVILLTQQCDYWIFWSNVLAAVSLLALFLGQRVAKDYQGAVSLVPYFIVSIIGIYLCG